MFAENAVLNSPLGYEPLIGRESVVEAKQKVHRLADLTYKEILSGETHHAASFRLQIEDTVVNGMDYARVDADGKIAEVTIWWRPLPSAVEMQGHLVQVLGLQPWELRTNGERGRFAGSRPLMRSASLPVIFLRVDTVLL